MTSVHQALTRTLIGDVTFHSYDCEMRNGTGTLDTMLIIECRPADGTQSAWGARLLRNRDESELLATLSSALVNFHAHPFPETEADILYRISWTMRSLAKQR